MSAKAPDFHIKRVNADKPAIWASIVGMDAKCFSHDSTPALADNAGAWWIAYVGEEAVGYCGIKKTHLGRGYLCRAGVLHRWRGFGLQKKLINRRVAYARAQGWPAVITDTNENIPSGNSLISCGFRLFSPDVKWAFETSNYWKKDLT